MESSRLDLSNDMAEHRSTLENTVIKIRTTPVYYPNQVNSPTQVFRFYCRLARSLGTASCLALLPLRSPVAKPDAAYFSKAVTKRRERNGILGD